MFKVMVVDDEAKIRRGLCRLVESFPLPLEICAQADDGVAAMQLVSQLWPDIILLDICMPNMDGLELLSLIKKNKMRTKCIIITGFDEFAFAKASVSLNAFAYLLKPIDDEELFLHMENALLELEAEQADNRRNQLAIDQLTSNESMLRQVFIQGWLAGDLSPRHMVEQLAFWQMAWPEKPWLLVLKPAFRRLDLTVHMEQDLLLYGVGNIAEELLQPLGVCFHCIDNRGCCVALLHREPGDAFCAHIQETIKKHLSLHCYMERALLRLPEDLPGVFDRMRSALEERESSRPLVESIKAYIRQNFHKPEISLTDLSLALSVSQSYVCKLLKTDMQTTFVEYLTKKRMEEAIRLLVTTDLKLYLVARQVGYQSQHYFSTVFKKYTGLSPSCYRETHSVDSLGEKWR